MMDSIRVLVVEDEEDLREILVTVLELEGLECRSANDGQDALEKIEKWSLEEWSPQVIISDITMPRLNGFQFLAILKEKNSKIPFIFMSGHADAELEMQAEKLGANGLQTKPFKGELVLEQIRKLVA